MSTKFRSPIMQEMRMIIKTAILICACFVWFAEVENENEKSRERRTSAWELVSKSKIKQAESAEPPMLDRVLHFPNERSLGRIMIGHEDPSSRPTPFGYPFEEIRWEYYGNAQGDVRMPLNKKVRLILDSWTWQNPQALSVLKKPR
jgi:hypothetical protein